MGGQFRLDDGKAANYTGPFVNYYEQVLLPRTKGNLHGAEIRRLIAIDSATQLLRFVRYFTIGKNDVSTETQFNSWRRFGDQWFPGEIVRLEAGRQIFRFQVTRAEVGDKLSPAAFGEVIP